MDHRSEYETKTIKLLKENIKVSLRDLELGSDFLDTTPKAQTPKEKTDKLGFLTIKNFWINSKVLQYSTGSYIQYPVINHNGKEYGKEYVYV